jgi:GNAT superfamily N-acetyltransferase
MSGLSITVETAPDAATVATIADGLTAFNEMEGGSRWQPEALWLVARDAGGAVVGGIKARIAHRWLEVDWLWVAQAHRKAGLGSALLGRAESVAAARGCQGAFLWTYSFQAPGFYEKHGYTAFGRLDGIPPGHARIHYAKRF